MPDPLHLPHAAPPVWPQTHPARFAAGIITDLTLAAGVSTPRFALLGLPDDLGVRLNNGRPGTAQGPAAFRGALASSGVSQPAGFNWPTLFDAGDVTPAPGNNEAALHETHRRVYETALALHRAGFFPIAVGGGHDLTYPFVKAAADHAGRPLHGVYLDAHLDVRETVGSGMPFRRLLSGGHVSGLALIGVNPLVNTAEHTDWFLAHGGRFTDTPPTGVDFASIDLDAIDAAFAPGVSAMNPAGLTSTHATELVARIAATPSLRCLDFMELSPPHDHERRTARLAAHLFLTALRALAAR